MTDLDLALRRKLITWDQLSPQGKQALAAYYRQRPALPATPGTPGSPPQGLRPVGFRGLTGEFTPQVTPAPTPSPIPAEADVHRRAERFAEHAALKPPPGPPTRFQELAGQTTLGLLSAASFGMIPASAQAPDDQAERIARGLGTLIGYAVPYGAGLRLGGLPMQAAARAGLQGARPLVQTVGQHLARGAGTGAVIGATEAAVAGEKPTGVLKHAAEEAALFGAFEGGLALTAVALRPAFEAAKRAWHQARVSVDTVTRRLGDVAGVPQEIRRQGTPAILRHLGEQMRATEEFLGAEPAVQLREITRFLESQNRLPEELRPILADAQLALRRRAEALDAVLARTVRQRVEGLSDDVAGQVQQLERQLSFVEKELEAQARPIAQGLWEAHQQGFEHLAEGAKDLLHAIRKKGGIWAPPGSSFRGKLQQVLGPKFGSVVRKDGRHLDELIQELGYHDLNKFLDDLFRAAHSEAKRGWRDFLPEAMDELLRYADESPELQALLDLRDETRATIAEFRRQTVTREVTHEVALAPGATVRRLPPLPGETPLPGRRPPLLPGEERATATAAQAAGAPTAPPLPEGPGGIPSPVPDLEGALTAGRRPALGVQVREAADELKGAFDEIFEFEPRLRDFPDLRNRIRLFQDTGRDAERGAAQALSGVLQPLRHQREYELFRRQVALRDFVETAEQGLPLPRGITAEQARQEAARLWQVAAELGEDTVGRVREALQRHDQLVRSLGEELVARGKLSPESLREHYFPHRVLDYTAQIELQTPGMPRRLRAPFRYYTQERLGSVRDIDTDYARVMLRHISKVRLDNAVDDFAQEIAQRYDLLARLPQEARRAILERGLRPGQIVELGGKRYRAWQYEPGRQLFGGQIVNPSLLEDALAEGLTVAEWLARTGPRGGLPLREAAVLGQQRPFFLLEEPIAEVLSRLRQTPQMLRAYRWIVEGTSLWKRLTLNFAGVPFQMGNFVGDLINLVREDPAALALVPRAIAMLLRGSGRELEMAQAHRVLESGLFRTRGHPLLQARAGRLVHPIVELWARFNPMQVVERGSELREQVLRLAKFLKDVQRIERGQQVVARAIDLRGLEPLAAAGKVAREFTVDYGAVSPAWQASIRGLLLPFATFYVENARNWGRYVLRHPTDALARFGVPAAAMFYWNNTKFPEIEAGLPDYYRYMPHIITGYKTEDGRPVVIAFQTPVDLAGQVFGLDRLLDKLGKLERGELTAAEAAKQQLADMALGVPRMVHQLTTPLIKAFADVGRNRDSFTGRAIVPERLKGTEEGRRLQIQYVLGQFLTPYAQYLRAAHAPEPGPAFTKTVLQGPLDVPRALGVRTPDLEREAASRAFEALDVADVRYRTARHQMEQAVIQTLAHGDSGSLAEALRALAQQGIVFRADQLRNLMTSPRVQIAVVQEQLRSVRDPAARQALQARLAVLRRLQLLEGVQGLPRTVRADVGPALPPTGP